MKGWFSLCNLADEEKLCVRSEISVLRAYSRQTARHRRLLSLWLCSAEPVAMVSPAWHSGSSGGVTAGEGGGGSPLLLMCKRSRPPAGHWPPHWHVAQTQSSPNYCCPASSGSHRTAAPSRQLLHSLSVWFKAGLFLFFLFFSFFSPTLAYNVTHLNSGAVNCSKCVDQAGAGGCGLCALLDLLAR